MGGGFACIIEFVETGDHYRMDSNGKTRHSDEPDQIAGDRREDRRYPIELELKYKLIRRKKVLETGIGRTIDLSSGGVYFQAEHPLPSGLNVELSIDWPVLLHNIAPMRLLVAGRIVRSDRVRIAVRSVQHEFRTKGGHASQVEPTGNGRSEERGSPASATLYYFQSAPAGSSFGKL
jgi:PilZ domain-containing protein